MNTQDYIDGDNRNMTLGDNATDPAVDAPIFFSVSPLKLLVMSVCTFGIYDLYWFYKNWCVIKEWSRPNIRPFWRAFFAYFFCFGVFQLIQEQAESQKIESRYSPILLTVGWVVFTLLWRLPDSYWLISYLAVVFLIPAQRTVNRINESLAPQLSKNNKFTAWNIVVVVIGGMLCLAEIAEPLWFVE